MKSMDVRQDATVLGSAEAMVEAPPETVWGVLTGFERWPEWNSSVSKMDFMGGLKLGSEFTWVAAGSRIRSRIEALDGPHRIVWSGRTLGIRAVHVWELEEVDGATRVCTRESFDGLPVRLFPRWMAKMLDKTLRHSVADLKREAEARGKPAGRAAVSPKAA